MKTYTKESITQDLVTTGVCDIPKLGKFSVVDRAPRVGRNPRTGDTVQIAASRSVHFKPSATLKAALNAK